MKLEELSPEVQRILFLSAELIKEEPRDAMKFLLQAYEVGFSRGTLNGVTRVAKELRNPPEG